VKRADFDPIRPIAQGADVIHAEIVKNIEVADLVLCDISSLNPNVFFELGCCTALNMPVCYVMDDLTRGIPFDTGIINHHTYSHALVPWTIESEVDRLANHVRISSQRSAGKNMLWRYFGLRSVAHAARSGDVDRDRVDYLVMQVEAIRKGLEERPIGSAASVFYDSTPYQGAWATGVKAEPGFTTTYGTVMNSLMPQPPDWDKVIKDSENDLAQMERLQMPNKARSDVENVKGIIEGHIKSLGDLIDSEPQSERAAQALTLQARLRSILSGNR
jgi:hypothetical protein